MDRNRMEDQDRPRLRAALYYRQNGTGHTLLEQRAALEQYAGSKGYDVAGAYVDNGSGNDLARKGLSKMLEDVQANQVDVVLCHSLSRISRNMSHTLGLLDVLEAHRVGLETVKEGRISESLARWRRALSGGPDGSLKPSPTAWLYRSIPDNPDPQLREELCKALTAQAAHLGYAVAGISLDTRCDEDVMERQGIQEALRAVEAGRAGLVLTPTLLQISADPERLGQFLDELEDAGGALETVMDGRIPCDLFHTIHKYMEASADSRQAPKADAGGQRHL